MLQYASATLVAFVLATGSFSPRLQAQRPDTLRLTPWIGGLRTIDTEVAGLPARLLFDTGAGQTFLSPERWASGGCAPDGRLVGFRMTGERVEWPRCAMVSLRLGRDLRTWGPVGAFDLMALLGPQLPPGVQAVAGAVGLDAFRGERITLLLADDAVVRESETSFRERTASMTEVPVRLATGHDGSQLTVLVKTLVGRERAVAWLLLDSGNLAGLILSPSTGAGAAAGADPVPLDFGGGVVLAAAPSVSDVLYDGVLSRHELVRLIVALDLAAGRAWLGSVPAR